MILLVMYAANPIVNWAEKAKNGAAGNAIATPNAVHIITE